MNNKLPSTQEASLVLGVTKKTKKSTHQSILMGYLLKGKQTQQSSCRPEAAIYKDLKKKKKD